MARLSRRHYELLTPAETERQLSQLVSDGEDKQGEPGSVDLAKFAGKRLSKPKTVELRQLKQKLMVLALQANPLLRSSVVDYEQVIDRILAHKTKGLMARFASLAGKRQQIQSRTSKIDDYMNWFEATQSGTASGAFTGYLRAAARSLESHSRRRDPLSVYLDALEEQF